MRSRRGAIVLAVVALIALAVAVPVVAGSLATPGGTGTLNFVNVNQYGPDWQSAPPINPRGPAGGMVYTTSVITTQTVEPQQFVSYAFTASRLCRGTNYALVNVFALHNDPTQVDPDDVALDVYVLGYGTANKAGIVCIKGCAPLAHLNADPPQLGLSEFLSGDGRTSGARLRLVATSLLQAEDNPEHVAEFFVRNGDGVLFSVLGVPLILPDNWVPAAP